MVDRRSDPRPPPELPEPAEDPTPFQLPPPAALAAAAGALWGGIGYAILWGHLPIVAGRRFVLSGVGTLAFLPVRLVLWGIRTLERWVGRTFDLAETNWWIGASAAVLGAALAAGAVALVRLVASAVRRARPA